MRQKTEAPESWVMTAPPTWRARRTAVAHTRIEVWSAPTGLLTAWRAGLLAPETSAGVKTRRASCNGARDVAGCGGSTIRRRVDDGS